MVNDSEDVVNSTVPTLVENRRTKGLPETMNSERGDIYEKILATISHSS